MGITSRFQNGHNRHGEYGRFLCEERKQGLKKIIKFIKTMDRVAGVGHIPEENMSSPGKDLRKVPFSTF